MSKWKVYALDVWGNKEDGWDVNNKFHIATVDDNDGKEDIINLLYNEEIIITNDTEKFDVEQRTEDWIEICVNEEDGEPLFWLEREVR